MSDFNVNVGADGVPVLSFESDRASECVKYALANDIKRLELVCNYSHNTLDPLFPLKESLEGLILNDRVDSSGLCQFTNIQYLGVPDNKKNVLDLTSFPRLKTLACSVTERLKGLDTCKHLESLTISYYNPDRKDLSELPFLPYLRDLSIFKTRIVTLDGVEHFPKLKSLEIYSAPALKTIWSLKLLPNLEEIVLETCKKVEDYETLAELGSLKKIVLTECREIPSLAFVREMRGLRFISFVNTTVVDGDISPCQGLVYVGFDDKKHYNRKMRDFRNGVAH